jgi:acetyltransferase-like isoleucine patch superfamily enzyme
MKSIISLFITCLPFNGVRVFFYRIIFKYNIDSKSKIGMFNIINCRKLKMENAQIGFFNQIIVNDLTLKDNSTIKKRNRLKHLNILVLKNNSEIRSDNFIGAPVRGTIDDSIDFLNQNLYIGRNSSILRSNYFDIVDEVFIGENVVFGGNGSEIWTHGFDTKRKMIVGKIIFGNNIFVGSNCVFTKGISIADEITIAPLSVIYKSITEKGVYSTHEIKKIK